MPSNIVVWLMTTLSFAMPFIFGQPARAPEASPSSYTYELAADKYGVWPTKEFETAKPPWWLQTWALRPLNSAESLLKPISGDGAKNESIIALHKGKIVYEWYNDGWDKDKQHFIASCTKSVVSALVGVAVADGFIKSVDDKVVDYFPGAKIAIDAEQKKDITIRQLLTMTSGLAGDMEWGWEAWFAANPGEKGREELNRRFDKDSAKTMLECLSMTTKPGEQWNYSSNGSHLLLGIVAKAIGQPIETYVDKKLFGPMGITNYEWHKYGDLYSGGGGLDMTPRDMAKFGYLYLNNGRWENKQLVPAAWAAHSAPASKSPFGYGYQFWNIPYAPFGDAYGANGAAGQRIYVYPSQDLVIVRTGNVFFSYTISF